MDRTANATPDGRSLETDGGEESGPGFRESSVEIEGHETRRERPADERSAHGSRKRPLGEAEVYCWNCGVPVASIAEICPTCGVRQHPASNHKEKDPGLAAIASAVWVGAGQIYNGEIAKGIGLMVLMFVSTVSVVLLVGFLTTPIIWVYAVYDAYRTAERINQRRGAVDEF